MQMFDIYVRGAEAFLDPPDEDIGFSMMDAYRHNRDPMGLSPSTNTLHFTT